MEPFLVNLMDPAQLRYLKITLHVESNQEKPNEEYEKRLPQLRDAILIILSSKNYKDIMDSEGKTSLREEIKTKMNQLLVDLKVQNIYFTEFVVQ
jgi:flagellar FliL protein